MKKFLIYGVCINFIGIATQATEIFIPSFTTSNHKKTDGIYTKMGDTIIGPNNTMIRLENSDPESDGLYIKKGNTIYGPDEIYTQNGNMIYSSSKTCTQIGNIIECY